MEYARIGEPETYDCAGAWYTRRHGIGKNGRPWEKDYLCLKLLGYGKYNELRIPTSDRQGTAWDAFRSVLLATTGVTLNGDAPAFFSGKTIKVAKYKVSYNSEFSDERDLVVGISGQSTLTAGAQAAITPAVDVKAMVLEVMSECKTIREVVAALKSVKGSLVADAIFELYDNGTIFEPAPGVYQKIDAGPPEEAVKATAIDSSADPSPSPIQSRKPFLVDLEPSYDKIKTRLAAALLPMRATEAKIDPYKEWGIGVPRNETLPSRQMPLGPIVNAYDEKSRNKVLWVIGALETDGIITTIKGNNTVYTNDNWSVEFVEGRPAFVQKVQTT